MGGAVLSTAISLAVRIVFPVDGAYFSGYKTPSLDRCASSLCQSCQKVIIFRVVFAGVSSVSQFYSCNEIFPGVTLYAGWICFLGDMFMRQG